jgi:hypothetical protein
MLSNPAHTIAVTALLALAGAAHAQVVETEPNDNKAAANPAVLANGGTITGHTTGSSTINAGPASADNFLVQTAAAPLGIYLHQMTVNSEVGNHTLTIRGLTQTAGSINFGTDSAIQTSSSTTTPPRFIQWYGFGKQEQVYMRVTGASTTTSDYTVTLNSSQVTPLDAGTYYQGNITLSRAAGNTADCDMWVYDSQFNAIADYGNDDPDTLTRNFAPGTYYVAYSASNLANNQPAASGDTFLTGAVLDFADAVASSATTTQANLGIRIADDFGPVDTAAARGRHEVVWFTFTVSATAPTTGSCCLPDGTCVTATTATCATLGGAYGGDGSDCGTANCPQPGACCLGTDFTCTILSASQCATAGGTYQGNGSACGTCPQPPAGSVLLLVADSATNMNDVKAKLDGTGLFPVVVAKLATGTANPIPSLEYISQFDAVMTWTNVDYSSATDIGNRLADYVDAGGGVVVPMFANSSTAVNRQLGGRWDATYQIIPQGGGNLSTGGVQGIGTPDDPNHPILASVNSFLGGTSSFRPVSTAFTAHGVRVAPWTDGKTLVAVSNTLPNRVDLGTVPYSSTASASAGWNATTDGARLMANALLYTMGPSGPVCGTADFDGDGDTGTDADIEAFFACLAGNCCATCFAGGADFNGDGDTGTDADIESFFRVLAGGPC